jgi:hypothetical protein
MRCIPESPWKAAMIMGTLATILGAAGAMLILVGLVGGGFTFSGSVMPKVGKLSRVLCFAIGGVLLLMSIGLVATDVGTEPAVAEPPASSSPGGGGASPPPAPPQEVPAEPAVGYVYVGAGYTAYVFELPSLDAGWLTELPDGTEVHILCTAQGETVTSPVTGYTSSLWNYTTDGGFLPDAIVDTGTDQATMPSCV